jgi:hypothetical protein
MHPHARECQNWTHSNARVYLSWLCNSGMLEPHGPLLKGFKAPGWQISDETFAVLKEAGWFVADQPYNRDRRPQGIRYHELDSGNHIHGHIGHLGGHNANELSLIWDEIMNHRGEVFEFLSQNLTVQN